jgi:hypothetical protein
MADLPDVTFTTHSGGYMGITTPSQDRAPAWLPTAEIPLQRQAPPLQVGFMAPPVAAPAIPRPRQPRPVATYVVAAGLAVGLMGAVGAVQGATPDSTTPAAPSGGYVANVSVPGRIMTSFGDGTWQIGVDVEPGTYTTGRAADPACHHALRNSRTGTNVAEDWGSSTVVLTEADGWFQTSGCATWKRAG